jgi:hypothetical protein
VSDQLDMFVTPPALVALPPGVEKCVMNYGGGVNTIAALVLLKRHGVRPEAIVMADPGSERRGTIEYRDTVAAEWLRSVGFPPVTVITRIEEGKRNPRAWRLETLYDECFRIKSLPSIAFGLKKCSAKYKGDPQRWWSTHQAWILDEWLSGRRVAKVIGYDADELRRVKHEFPNAWEAKRFVPFHPLVDAGLTRDDCVDLIRSEGLAVPPGSACQGCPANTFEEWKALRVDEPDEFARWVAMSRNAVDTIQNPDVVGLMRCNPPGKRQLHVWADGGYGPIDEQSGCSTELPCECAS